MAPWIYDLIGYSLLFTTVRCRIITHNTHSSCVTLQTVYDHDTFSLDDKMGDAEFDIKPFIEAVKMGLQGLPDGTIITKVPASRSNCLSEESCVVWKDGKVVQDMCLRLRNVECGEVEIELQWINVPGSRGLVS